MCFNMSKKRVMCLFTAFLVLFTMIFTANTSIVQASSTMKYYNDLGPIPEGIDYPSTVVLYKYENCIVKTQINATKYTQTNYTYYLSATAGAQFASKCELSLAAGTIFTAMGFIPKVGPAITISAWALGTVSASKASAIRKYTDQGKKVKISTSSSSIGSSFKVEEWTGNECVMTRVNKTSAASEVLLSVAFS